MQSVFTACSAQLAGTSAKSKSAVFALLRALVLALDVSYVALCPLRSPQQVFDVDIDLNHSSINLCLL